MRISSLLPLLFLVLQFCSIVRAENYGFFVGANGTHLETPFKPLNCAPNDAIAMAYRYVAELGVIPPENAFLFLDGSPSDAERENLDWLKEQRVNVLEKATATRIKKDWEKTSQQISNRIGDGFLLVFVSAHGIEKDGVPYFIAPPDDKKGVDHVSIEAIRASMATLGDNALSLLLVDACRVPPPAGKGGFVENTRFIEALSRTKGSLVFSSCRSAEYSYEDEVRGYGVFTSSFLDAARGEFDYGDSELIPLSSIIDKVSLRVSAAAKAAKNGKQTPTILGDGQGTAIPVGVSPVSPFVIKRFESRLAHAKEKISAFQNPHLQPMLHALNGRNDDLKKRVISRVEVLPKMVSAAELEGLSSWWKRTLEKERASERANYFGKGRGEDNRKTLAVFYATSSPQDNSFREEFFDGLTKIDSIQMNKVSDESAAKLQNLLSTPSSLRFELVPGKAYLRAEYQDPEASLITLNAGEFCDAFLKVKVEGRFSMQKTFFSASSFSFDHRVEWSLVPRDGRAAATYAFSGKTLESEHLKFKPVITTNVLGGKNGLFLWQHLDPALRKRTIETIVQQIEDSLQRESGR